MFYFCSRKMNHLIKNDMEVISKILMAIFNLVVQFIGFIVLFYMLCFAVLCIFTHSNKSNTAYATA